MTYRIKGWVKFQHFKDRRPPWIKLYRDILEDPDWHDLDGDTAKILVALWLLASEDEDQEGKLPDARRLAFRLRLSETKVNQALTKLSHWLDRDDINSISSGYQDDAPETETETETERETERERERERQRERQRQRQRERQRERQRQRKRRECRKPSAVLILFDHKSGLTSCKSEKPKKRQSLSLQFQALNAKHAKPVGRLRWR